MSASTESRGFFRTAPWLHRSRALGWCICLAVFSAIAMAASLITSPHGVTSNGTLISPDFVTFYGASSFVHEGRAAAAYDHAAFAARLQDLVPNAKPGDYAFLYPPTFLLLCVGLSRLPYLPAALLFLAVTLLALLLALRPLLHGGASRLAAIAYPAVLINIGNGQNGFATGACFAAAMAFGDRAPLSAGACLGLLSIKPQLAVLVPVGLALAQRWRSLAACAASALGLALVAGLTFGFDAWRAWAASAGLSRTILDKGYNGYQNMLSVFASVRLLHGGVALAYAAQGAAAVCVLAMLVWIVPRQTRLRPVIAIIAVATLLATPWSLDYDLVVLAGPLAWMAGLGTRTGWRDWEKIVLLAVYVLPLVTRNLAADTGIDIAPLVLLALFLVMAGRVRADRADEPVAIAANTTAGAA